MYVYFKRLHWTKSILPCWLQICCQRFEFIPQSSDWRLVDRKLCSKVELFVSSRLLLLLFVHGFYSFLLSLRSFASPFVCLEFFLCVLCSCRQFKPFSRFQTLFCENVCVCEYFLFFFPLVCNLFFYSVGSGASSPLHLNRFDESPSLFYMIYWEWSGFIRSVSLWLWADKMLP